MTTGKPVSAAFLAMALGALAAQALSSQAHADPAAGRKLVEEVCQQCHGLDGLALEADAPNLAGQNRSYLARQLWAFRAGERQDPKMSPSAVGLSDQDIIDVAEWYSSIDIAVKSPQ